MLAEQVLTFAANAPGIQNQRTLVANFTALVEPLGVRRFGCAYMRREAASFVMDKAISNIPRQWQERYLKRGFEMVDPVMQAVLRGVSFGYWDEVLATTMVDRRGREVLDLAAEYGMREGFTRRIMLESGGMAVMMVAGEKLQHTPRARAALGIALSVFANEGVRMLKWSDPADNRPGRERKALTKMQLKVLLMRAEGHSIKSIAGELKRHPKTIECHVTEMLRRLQARNTLEAVRIARGMKLIV